MSKLVYVQSILPKDVIQSLKKKAGESNIHQALSKAIYHYLDCNLL